MKVVKTVFKILLLPLVPILFVVLTVADFVLDVYED